MGQQKQPIAVKDEYLDRLHTSLRANFVPLPESTNMLTDEQLSEVFGGDWNAIRDIVRLAGQNIPDNLGE